MRIAMSDSQNGEMPPKLRMMRWEDSSIADCIQLDAFIGVTDTSLC